MIPLWKKEAAFWSILINTIVFAIVPGPLLAPSTYALAEVFNAPLTKIAELSGYQLLVVGALGPLVSVLAQKYGKRPQFLFAAVTATLGTIICIVGSEQFRYKTLLAGRMVQGLGITAWESLSLASVGDLFYLHERGWRAAVVVAALACMASLVAIIGGAMTEYVGWSRLFWACLPFNLVSMLSTILLIPETQYPRQNTEFRPGVYTKKSPLHLLSEIFIHLSNPTVVWIMLISGVSVSTFVTTSYILSQIWSVPPYSLNVAQNGYFFAGALIAGVIAIPAGPLCDWSARALSRLNKGIYEAEFRIPINILAVLCCSCGWFLFMWVVDHPRPNGYLLGSFCYGLTCFGISIASTSAGLYVLDAFPKQSTEIFVLQMMVKNFMFYGFSTFINTWATEKGAGNVFKTYGILSVCLFATCIPMYVFGKLNRKVVHKMRPRSKLLRAIT
ncbi:MFS general substrate transporter [Pleurostoma richardsiae]|uniref:MFS general substrate transporter n=1 Tax=Pleurostoma richardsiae TaxID=41990 RepID=A0AA38VMA3_9PEZI|nr:MFS general substrate transporter [Pleurostoma richardsiae]